MKRIISIILLFFIILKSNLLFSQTFSAHISTSPIHIWSNKSYIDDSVIEVVAGTGKINVAVNSLHFQYTLKSKMSFKTGILYEIRRVTDKCAWRYVNEGSPSEPYFRSVYDCNFSKLYKYKEVGVPLLVSYNIFRNAKMDYHIGAGVRLSYRVDLYHKLINKLTNQVSESTYKVPNRKNMMYMFEAGAQYNINSKLYAVSDVTYFYKKYDGNGHLVNLSLGLGYNFYKRSND